MLTHRLVLVGTLVPALLGAQEHVHRPGMTHDSAAAKPAATTRQPPGQAAFGSMAEIVRILEADRATDWSKVNLEALRQHLIDMDDVTLRAAVVSANVTGGARFTVTGTGRVADAIRRMARAHAATLGPAEGMRATVEDVPSGARVTVVATDGESTVAKIRGLGFVGLLTTGDHHGPHHLAMARGEPPGGHAHDE